MLFLDIYPLVPEVESRSFYFFLSLSARLFIDYSLASRGNLRQLLFLRIKLWIKAKANTDKTTDDDF